MRLTRIVKEVTVTILFSLGLALPHQDHAQQKGLTSQQVETLLKVHAPDSLVASQIRTRGVSFSVSTRSIEHFTSEGAGPETIAALKSLIRVGSIFVQTERDGAVSVDGKDAGNAGPDGSLLIKDLSIGQHQLSVSKEGFQVVSNSVSVIQNQVTRINLPLTWAGGYLSVVVEPADSVVTVTTGTQALKGPFINLPCSPGAYTITVEASGRLSQSRTIKVEVGEHHAEMFTLELDPATISRKLAEARSKLNGGDPLAARSIAENLLQQQPESAELEQIIAIAAFEQGDMNRFVDAGSKALRNAQPISIPLMHVHVFLHPWLHQVQMTVSEQGLTFTNQDGKCKMPQTLDYALILSANVVRNQQGSPMLHLVYSSKPHGAIVHDLDFVPNGSEIVSRAPGQFTTAAPSISEPSNGVEQMNGVVRLVIRARR